MPRPLHGRLRPPACWAEENRSSRIPRFSTPPKYCRLTASLIPVALVPKSLRDQLIQCSSSGAKWNLIAPVFVNEPGSVDDPHVDDAHFAEGTVKNKPSNLYAHLGVRNRRDALARGYEYGYLPSVG